MRPAIPSPPHLFFPVSAVLARSYVTRMRVSVMYWGVGEGGRKVGAGARVVWGRLAAASGGKWSAAVPCRAVAWWVRAFVTQTRVGVW